MRNNYLQQVIPVIVTYNPDILNFTKLVDSLVLFDEVTLVDNGSDNVSSLQALCSTYNNILAQYLPSNVGLAQAQNIAIDSIKNGEIGVFVLLFDQDSVPVNDCIEVLHGYANELINNGVNLGVIGPALEDAFCESRYGFIKNGKRFYKEDAGNSMFQCDGINSSGSLIPLEAWQELGGNNKELFIDHVETDWCFRARAAGYVCYGTFDALLSHSMGESTIKYWFFGWRTMPDRTPERHYYLFRNSIFLQQQSYVPISWKYKNVLKLILTISYFGVFHRHRVKHTSNMYVGLKDGINKRLGVKK